jgi:hypothetical protein
MTIPRDKKLHFMAGLLLSAAGFWWFPFCVLGFLAGWFKEELDLYRNGEFDPADVVATWAGAFVSTSAVVLWKAFA